MDHVYEKHAKCRTDRCMICDGGLSHCTVCGGLEGSLTTECAGVRLAWDQTEKVYAGDIDFIRGRWTNAPSRNSPAGWVQIATAYLALGDIPNKDLFI